MLGLLILSLLWSGGLFYGVINLENIRCSLRVGQVPIVL